MSKQSNQPDPYLAIRAALQAREILLVLEKHGCVGNAHLLYQWLGTLGMGPSHRDLDELLDRMEKEGLMTTEMVERLRVVKLTRTGVEVAQARVGIDWIARVDMD